VELDESGSDGEQVDDTASLNNQLDGPQDDDTIGLEGEEEDTDLLLDAMGAEPKAKDDVRSWEELCEQIKDDQRQGHKEHAPHSHMNKLTLLRNFATLRIKGMARIAASEEIARQFHEGAGVHFARKIRFIARHYQLFEQLPDKERGGDRGRSLLNDERIQTAARAHLLTLATGEVTLRRFHHALNARILPALGYTLARWLSEHTARRWLIKLGWRRTMLKKGVYMDGHERPDVVEYRLKTFLPLMALHEKKMVQWVARGSELVRVDPDLGPGEKRVIAVFQDESCFHVNEYKQDAWCAP
jgi:hypothetical protein